MSTQQHGKYCEDCGRLLITKRRKRGFNQKTGKIEYYVWKQCSKFWCYFFHDKGCMGY